MPGRSATISRSQWRRAGIGVPCRCNGACARAIRDAFPGCRLIVAAGAHAQRLQAARGQQLWVEPFVPQKALLPTVDVVIHHGGNNSFTESLFYATPMLILPFSSDQFSIAYDAERAGLAHVLDPNQLSAGAIQKALHELLRPQTRQTLTHLQQGLRARGPVYAAVELLKRVPYA